MTIYTREKIRKTIPVAWMKLSKYLGLDLSWKEFLGDCKKKFDNFEGFKLIKSKFPPSWYSGFESKTVYGKTVSYVFVAYHPELRIDLEWHLVHELIHLLRGTINQNRFKHVSIVRYELEEALCDVIATKSTGKREKELVDKGLYNWIDVCALEQIINKMSDKKIIHLSLMPKNEREFKQLTFFALKLMSSEEFKTNIKRIWNTKIKEKVYY